MSVKTIWWIRRDLRLDDNPTLQRALRSDALLPVYVHAPDEEAPWQMGGAQKWWLARSLASHARALEQALAEARLRRCRAACICFAPRCWHCAGRGRTMGSARSARS